MGAASIYYPWSLRTWQAAAVVFAFLPVLLLACVSAVAARRARHGSKTA
jgi:hypothetical protein